jgi:hypothetical protein
MIDVSFDRLACATSDAVSASRRASTTTAPATSFWVAFSNLTLSVSVAETTSMRLWGMIL